MKYKRHIKKNNFNTIDEINLNNFGLNNMDELRDRFRKSNNDKYTINDIDRAVDLINDYKNRPVFIFGDYDADGVTAMSIIYLALKFKHFKYVDYIAPRRDEGFGLNKDMVNKKGFKANENKFKCSDCLIITVDNGIAQLDTIEHAKKLGFKVIVTDHHLPVIEDGVKKLPSADIVIDPNAIDNQASFNGYCGAGIAYKIACKLLGDDDKKYLLRTIASIGTVCDQMDLREENYVIVKNALYDLNNKLDSQLPAFKALADVFQISKRDSTTYGYTIGPAINALERVENGACLEGVKLFTSFDYDKCFDLAVKLKSYNSKRKYLTSVAMEKAEMILAEIDTSIKKPIIINIPDIKEGLIGIVAGDICEKYKIPVGVFTNDSKNSHLKGSFRSIEGFNISDLLNKCRDEFITCGGHAAAAGASVEIDNFDNMKKALHEKCPEISTQSLDDYYYDLEIDNSNIINAIEDNEKFEPFGMGHDPVKFKINNFDLEADYGSFIKEMKNDSVRIKSKYSKGIGFGKISLLKDVDSYKNLTLYGSIEYNHRKKDNGEIMISPQIIFDDVEIN